jgi:hypothetical protein
MVTGPKASSAIGDRLSVIGVACRPSGRNRSPLTAQRLPSTSHRSPLLTLLLTALFAGAVTAAEQPRPTAENPVIVRASAEPKEVRIGDPIRYTVEILSTDAEVVVPVLSGTFGVFDITDFGQLPASRKDGVATQTWWYTLRTFETGDQFIPRFKVAYRAPGAELKEVEGNEVLVGVASLLAREPQTDDIRDIKPPEEVPIDWRPYLLVAGIVALIVLLGAVMYIVLNRPRRQRIIPPRPAYEVALEALDRLRARNLMQSGELEAYYVGLSGIVRRYLEDGFSLRAPEMTTEEFLATATDDSRLLASHRRLLGDFLTQADLVKFARAVPTLRDGEAAYEAARRFVDETRPQPEQARKPEAAREAA